MSQLPRAASSGGSIRRGVAASGLTAQSSAQSRPSGRLVIRESRVWLVLKLSWRNLWRNPRRSLITICSIGVGLGCSLFLTALGDGVYREVVDGAVRMHAGHVTVTHPRYIESPAPALRVPSVKAVREAAASLGDRVDLVKPLIMGQATVSTGSGSEGVVLTAVDPAAERSTSPLARHLVAGRYLEDQDGRGAVLGRRLADRLRLAPGKKLVVTTSDVDGELVTELLRVVGVFELGMEDTDGLLVQVPLETGRRLYHLGADEATLVGLVLADYEQQERVRRELARSLAGQPVVVLSWQEVLYDLASYITVQASVSYALEGVLFFVVVFTILNTILMSVVERTREFAVVLALGTTPALLGAQVMAEAVLLGVFGCLFGLAAGGAYTYYVEIHGLDLSGMFHQGTAIAGFAIDPVLRADLSAGLMLRLSLLVFCCTLLISLVPAVRSGRVRMAEALRTQ